MIQTTNLENKNILLLGGTGVIGKSLIKYLNQSHANLFVTTRRELKSTENVKYIRGDAKDNQFLRKLLSQYNIDAIIDFMIYDTLEFSERIELLLSDKFQYVYLSTYRVYAESINELKEDANYLKDSINDQNYLSTNEYALTKTEQELLIRSSEGTKWTIIRPSITYGANRLQLGAFESDLILPRVANGLPVPLPTEILDRKASITASKDVAKMICGLLMNESAYENIFNVTTSESLTWREISNIYSEVIGLELREVSLDDFLKIEGNIWQVKYDRMFDRTCSNDKVLKATNLDITDLTLPTLGLKRELENIDLNNFKNSLGTFNRKNGNIDRILGIFRTPVNLNFRSYIQYLVGRVVILEVLYLKSKSLYETCKKND
ncbi:NAD-dependent epimerase/dehydratase family protein [Vibrio ulleungensis]|uniref:NAD-dependent epimerase/dehydratase family protein n=1 Tax=Vibrio ulleungensis TaxID=2807619 RepID=A0ABS2HP79_9VIBR|nr:NAD-dependent epimerase/dehydratase family protein [Vibrio ulleungensis]MBM7037692.1 NAD-dependent epimerase/dehydratase family protein [Vibrio ulleungensis]